MSRTGETVFDINSKIGIDPIEATTATVAEIIAHKEAFSIVDLEDLTTIL